MWQVKHFSELTTKELFEIYKLRTAVFVVEQNRVYQEVDDIDLTAIHVFKEDANQQVIAYTRVFMENGHVTFGRVVIQKTHRGEGLGKALMQEVMQVIQTTYPNLPIEIEARVPVQNFYRQFAFKTKGGPFIFNTTPHVRMVHTALPATA